MARGGGSLHLVALSMLVACGPSADAIQAQRQNNPGYRLEDALTRCQSGNTTVYQALQGSDMAVVARSLDAAIVDCEAAATELRTTPLPGRDSALAARGISRMTQGLRQIRRACDVIDSQPARGRRIAQSGMRQYARGLADLRAAAR